MLEKLKKIARAAGDATRRKVASLPIVQTPEVQHALAEIGVKEKRCATCANFEASKREDILRQHPAFARAAAFLAPTQMGNAQKKVVDESGQPVLEMDEHSWDSLGGCRELGMAVLGSARPTCDGKWR